MLACSEAAPSPAAQPAHPKLSASPRRARPARARPRGRRRAEQLGAVALWQAGNARRAHAGAPTPPRAWQVPERAADQRAAPAALPGGRGRREQAQAQRAEGAYPRGRAAGARRSPALPAPAPPPMGSAARPPAGACWASWRSRACACIIGVHMCAARRLSRAGGAAVARAAARRPAPYGSGGGPGGLRRARRRVGYSNPNPGAAAQSYEYADPVTEFLECLFVRYDFEGAQLKLAQCEAVLDGDFFLSALREEFVENARLFIFETYCRIHQARRAAWPAGAPGGACLSGVCLCRRLPGLRVQVGGGGSGHARAARRGPPAGRGAVSALCGPMPEAAEQPWCCRSPDPAARAQCIDLGRLSGKLNMDPEAKKWIVKCLTLTLLHGCSASTWACWRASSTWTRRRPRSGSSTSSAARACPPSWTARRAPRAPPRRHGAPLCH